MLLLAKPCWLTPDEFWRRDSLKRFTITKEAERDTAARAERRAREMHSPPTRISHHPYFEAAARWFASFASKLSRASFA